MSDWAAAFREWAWGPWCLGAVERLADAFETKQAARRLLERQHRANCDVGPSAAMVGDEDEEE